jgi:hypothetical protein
MDFWVKNEDYFWDLVKFGVNFCARLRLKWVFGRIGRIYPIFTGFYGFFREMTGNYKK